MAIKDISQIIRERAHKTDPTKLVLKVHRKIYKRAALKLHSYITKDLGVAIENVRHGSRNSMLTVSKAAWEAAHMHDLRVLDLDLDGDESAPLPPKEIEASLRWDLDFEV